MGGSKKSESNSGNLVWTKQINSVINNYFAVFSSNTANNMQIPAFTNMIGNIVFVNKLEAICKFANMKYRSRCGNYIV